MECHYSCQTCSASVYLYQCLSCPTTRTLLGSTCICNSGLFQKQTAQCAQPSNSSSFVDNLYSNFLPLGDALYYINIGIFWVYVIVLLCRGSSPLMRMLINFAQITSLILYLPFRLDEVSHRFIKSLSGFNFGYFFQLLECTESGLPTVCTGYENLIGYILILACMLAATLIASCVMSILYKRKLQAPLSFPKYLNQSLLIVIFNTLDLSTVYLSLSLTRILVISRFVLVIVLLFLGVYGVVLRKYFSVLNSKEQAFLEYRQKNTWAYTYDQKYHLYYIDFLYEQQEQPEVPDEAMDNFVEEAENIFTGRKEDNTKAFFPSSNLIILEIIWKAVMGASVVLFFQYKPSLLVYPTLFLMLVATCWVGAFFSYEKVYWLIYMAAGLSTLTCYALYWFNFFWGVTIGVGIAYTGGTLFALIFYLFSCTLLEPKIVNQLFANEQQEEELDLSRQDSQKMKKQIISYETRKQKKKEQIKEQEEASEQDIVLFKPEKDDEFERKKRQLIREMQQMKKEKRNTEMRKSSVQSIPKEGDEKRDQRKEEEVENKFQKFGTVRPSSYQQKLTQRRISAMKKAEEKKSVQNIFDRPDEYSVSNEEVKSYVKPPSDKRLEVSRQSNRSSQIGKNKKNYQTVNEAGNLKNRQNGLKEINEEDDNSSIEEKRKSSHHESLKSLLSEDKSQQKTNNFQKEKKQPPKQSEKNSNFVRKQEQN